MKKDTGYDSNHSVSYSNSGEHLHDLHLSVEYGRGLRRGSCIKWTTSIQSISLISSLHLWTTPRWILASQTLPFCLPDHLVCMSVFSEISKAPSAWVISSGCLFKSLDFQPLQLPDDRRGHKSSAFWINFSFPVMVFCFCCHLYCMWCSLLHLQTTLTLTV